MPRARSRKLQGLVGAISGKNGKRRWHLATLFERSSYTMQRRQLFPLRTTRGVPFKPGTVLTTAWGVRYGDVEARKLHRFDR